jgi:predicted transcriptional regulator
MDEAGEQRGLLDLTAEIVAAYAGHQAVAMNDLPGLIDHVFKALRSVGVVEPEPPAETLVPAVPIKKSVMPDFIVCLEDGKKLKMLKRHLATHYGLTPAAYRQRWGLPVDYPMVAPAHAAQRSNLAKSLGLGRKPAAPAAAAERGPVSEPAAAAEPAAVAKKPAGRVFMRKRKAAG